MRDSLAGSPPLLHWRIGCPDHYGRRRSRPAATVAGKRGEVEPEDLSGNLLVQLGAVTEDLNRLWYQANTGEVVTDVQRHVKHPALGWMAATLDGRVVSSGAVFEAKFMLPWSFSEEAAAKSTCPDCSTICR